MTGSSGAAPAWRVSRGQLAIAAAWLVSIAVLGYVFYSGAAGQMLDLQVYRDGAAAVLHGHDLYSMITPVGLPFTYPPVGAVAAIPLTLLPFSVIKVAWLAMVAGPLLISLWFGFRPLLARLERAAPLALAGLAAASVLLYPVNQEFYFGQVDIFLVALCLLDCAVKHPRWPRGLLIGLAAAIKLEPGAFIIYLLITRRRKEALVAALSFAGFTALAWLVDPHDSAAYWTSAIFRSNRLGGNGSAANQSIRGVILREFKPHMAPAAVWIALALIVAVAGFAAARSCWLRGNDMAGIAITGLLSAELSPVAWVHHYCWLVVALGVIVGDGTNRRRVVTAAVIFIVFATRMAQWAQSMINSGSLAVDPGRVLEDTFCLAGLLTIVILYRIRPTAPEIRAWSPPGSQWRQARRSPLPELADGSVSPTPASLPAREPSGSG